MREAPIRAGSAYRSTRYPPSPTSDPAPRAAAAIGDRRAYHISGDGDDLAADAAQCANGPLTLGGQYANRPEALHPWSETREQMRIIGTLVTQMRILVAALILM